MKVLFDVNMPCPLRMELPGHKVVNAQKMGWGELENGDLIAAAEKSGFGALLTADCNLRYQQNLTGKRLSIVVLPSNKLRVLKAIAPEIRRTLDALNPAITSNSETTMTEKPSREPFYLSATVEEGHAATSSFWRGRTPGERLQYLHHVNTLEYGEEAMNAPRVRCYGRRKFGEEPDPKNVAYF